MLARHKRARHLLRAQLDDVAGDRGKAGAQRVLVPGLRARLGHLGYGGSSGTYAQGSAGAHMLLAHRARSGRRARPRNSLRRLPRNRKALHGRVCANSQTHSGTLTDAGPAGRSPALRAPPPSRPPASFPCPGSAGAAGCPASGVAPCPTPVRPPPWPSPPRRAPARARGPLARGATPLARLWLASRDARRGAQLRASCSAPGLSCACTPSSSENTSNIRQRGQ